MISIIIATKDRKNAIAGISLPSLSRQDSVDFEILVWDASNDESTQRVVEGQKTLFESLGISLIYTRAQRAGSAAQRNDAVCVADGSVVLFMDDDSELCPDGISIVKRYFDGFPWLKGMALPIMNKFPEEMKRKRGILSHIKKMFYHLFFGCDAAKREIRPSTNNAMPKNDWPGTAEWFSGCCMAFRKSVFDDLRFDERLQRFGGYALGEDVDFSHRVQLRFGEPLVVASAGHVVHHNVSGGRIGPDRARVSAMYYNTKIIRDNFNRYGKCNLLPFLWEQRLGRTVAMLVGGYRIADMVRGYLDYKKALRES